MSTLADWIGTCTASLVPLIELIRRHVLAADRVHGDDTTVPVLAKQKTIIGRLWAYVRDDRPFADPTPRRRSSFTPAIVAAAPEPPPRPATPGSSRPTLISGSAISMTPSANPARSPRQPARAFIEAIAVGASSKTSIFAMISARRSIVSRVPGHLGLGRSRFGHRLQPNRVIGANHDVRRSQAVGECQGTSSETGFCTNTIRGCASADRTLGEGLSHRPESATVGVPPAGKLSVATA